MPDALAHGAFHALLAAGQCGANTELLFDVVTVFVNVAVLAVDERRIVIVVTLRAQPPYNPVPVIKKPLRASVTTIL